MKHPPNQDESQTPSKRFEQLEELITTCRKAAVNDDWETLVKLRN